MSQFDTEREPLEVLFSQFVQDNRQGLGVEVEDYARQYPDLAEEIRDLFPTLLALERASQRLTKPLSVTEWPPVVGGLQLGDYQLLREIGRGGMGIVYEALQESMQRMVAVKVLPREVSSDPMRRQRFLLEAQTVARLSYRNIVPVIEIGESSGRCYFAMRLIEGVGLDWAIQRLSQAPHPLTSTEVLEAFREQGDSLTLDEIDDDSDDSLACEFNSIQRQDAQADKPASKWQLRRDSWRQFARIGIQAAKALQHAHQAGVLHRDIKPGNLLLDEAGMIWITDFGLAKTEQEYSLTGQNDVVGTLRYIAPERFDGKLDERSDIYSLGLTLLELCLQRRVFEQSSRSEMIRNIMEGNITPPRTINPGIPEALERILLKATAKLPAQRYRSTEALIQDLRAFTKGDFTHSRQAADSPSSQSTLAKREKERPFREIAWKKIAATLTLVCCLQMGLVWWQLYRAEMAMENRSTAMNQQLELQQRLSSLDALYEQTLQRNLASDLAEGDQLEPLPPDSSLLTAADHLLALYEQTLIEADRQGLADLQPSLADRLKLVQRLKP